MLEKSAKVEFFNHQVMNNDNVTVAICAYAFYLGGKLTNDGKKVFFSIKPSADKKFQAWYFFSDPDSERAIAEKQQREPH